MERFSSHNFSAFVFDWHVREGKQGRLLAETSQKRQEELGRFLQGGHARLAWMHDLHMGRFTRAGETLTELAREESQLLARKKVRVHYTCFLLQFTMTSLDNVEHCQVVRARFGRDRR